MDEQSVALKRTTVLATVFGIIGGLIGIVAGSFISFLGLLSSAFVRPEVAFRTFILGVILIAIGTSGFKGGRWAATKPTRACILQLIAAALLSLGIIFFILDGTYLEHRLFFQIFLLWPGLFWVGGTLLLNYEKRRVINKENMSDKREKLKRARNLGLIGSGIAISFGVCLLIYGLVHSIDDSLYHSNSGALSTYTISLMLFITSLVSFAASLLAVNYPKLASVTLATLSVIQAGWLTLIFLGSRTDRTVGLGLIWVLWLPFLVGASYQAIKLSKIE